MRRRPIPAAASRNSRPNAVGLPKPLIHRLGLGRVNERALAVFHRHASDPLLDPAFDLGVLLNPFGDLLIATLRVVAALHLSEH